MTKSPILLFGMPRSGTTWLGKIFDSHPDTLYRHEPDTEVPLHQLPLMASAPGTDDGRAIVVRYVENMAGMRAERVAAKQPIFSKRYRSALVTNLHRGGATVSKVAGRFSIGMPVIGAGPPRNAGHYRLVWKSIESLGRLGLILWALPDARSVQILRHPCGYVNSVIRGESARRFTHGGAADDFRLFELICQAPPARHRGLTLEHLRRLTPEERLAWRWVIFNEWAAEQALSSGRNLLLYYEELCSAPVEVTRRLFDFSDLSWNEQTASFVRDSTGSQRDGYYSVVKNPTDSAWKWQVQLDGGAIERVLAVMRQSDIAAPYFEQQDWTRDTRYCA